MAPRGRAHRKVGNTRMDAALDAMRQLGFKEQLVRETVEELLDVYEGTQGWPFIEEASYKLLIETILGKQQYSAHEKEDCLQDNARRDDVAETSSAAGITEVGSSNLVAQDSLLQTTRITEVGSSSLVAQDTVLHTNDTLDSASQTNDHESASFGNLETDVIKDATVPIDRGGHGQGITVESRNKQKLIDNVKGSNSNTLVSNVKDTCVRTSMIESSKTLDSLPHSRRKPCYGWIDDDDDDDGKLICFAIPPLPKQIEKLIGHNEAPPQSGSRRRGKSRWDEKPEAM